MRCKTCHYALTGLIGPPHRCPECGNPFDPNDPRTMAGPHNSWQQLALDISFNYALIMLSYALMSWPWAQHRPLSARMIATYAACGLTMLVMVVFGHLVAGDRFARLLLLFMAWLLGLFLFV